MSIRTKLFALLLIPVTTLLFFGGQAFLEKTRVVHEMDTVVTLSDLGVRMSALVHECQKERGYTAGYLGSGGARFADKLPQQRTLTDQFVADLRAALTGFDPAPYNLAFRTRLRDALDSLDQLEATRSAVTALEIPTPEAIGYYTAMNGAFLDAIGAIANESGDADLAIEIAAFTNFLKSKERAGIERAVLSNTFAADKFGPGMYARFIRLVGAQDNYLDAFKTLASEDAIEAFDRAATAPPFADVAAIRAVAMNKAAEGGFGIDAGDWFATITGKINLLKDVEVALSDQLINNAGKASAQASAARLMIGLLVVSVSALALLSGMVTVRSITKPLAIAVDGLGRIANGDLTVDMDNKRKDEIGQIVNAANTTARSLSKVLSDVIRTAGDVAAAATQVSASSEEMATSITEQTSHVSQVSAAMEEMAASVGEVARKSAEASTLANDAGSQARDGGEIVSQTVEGIESIACLVGESARAVDALGHKSDTIGEIIETISDIADQTNLLALNAAIEAARAGDQGRGFAVVADEVRKLAERTQTATEEVSRSITEIQQETRAAVKGMSGCRGQVDSGVRTAEQAGESLRTIVQSSDIVSESIADIAAAADEQTAAVDEASQSIMRISAVSSQSSEGARQSAEAASMLSNNAEQLNALVAAFKVREQRR